MVRPRPGLSGPDMAVRAPCGRPLAGIASLGGTGSHGGGEHPERSYAARPHRVRSGQVGRRVGHTCAVGQAEQQNPDGSVRGVIYGQRRSEMAAAAKNTQLGAAKAAKNDEFYTQW